MKSKNHLLARLNNLDLVTHTIVTFEPPQNINGLFLNWLGGAQIGEEVET